MATALVRGNNKELDYFSILALRVPIGSVLHCAKSTPNESFLVCDGGSLSTTTYSKLFNVIGYTFGGSGGTFNLPDLRGRIAVGAGTKALGTSGSSASYVTGKWTTSLDHNSHTHTLGSWGASTAATPGSHTISGSDSETLPHYLALNVIICYTSTSSISAIRGLVRGSNKFNEFYNNKITAKVGSIALWAGASAPSGWLMCNGSAISRSTYAELFAAMGTIWGVGDGSTTFNLPNFNNYFLSGYISGGPYSNRNTINLGPKTKAPSNAVTPSAHVSHTHPHTGYTTISVGWGSHISCGNYQPAWLTTTTTISVGNASDGSHTHTFSGGDVETRPDNNCGLYIIRYQ